jgi:hypothetical protein
MKAPAWMNLHFPRNAGSDIILAQGAIVQVSFGKKRIRITPYVVRYCGENFVDGSLEINLERKASAHALKGTLGKAALRPQRALKDTFSAPQEHRARGNLKGTLKAARRHSTRKRT